MTDAEKQVAYTQGYDWVKSNPGEGPQFVNQTSAGDPAFPKYWTWQGAYDALYGNPNRFTAMSPTGGTNTPPPNDSARMSQQQIADIWARSYTEGYSLDPAVGRQFMAANPITVEMVQGSDKNTYWKLRGIEDRQLGRPASPPNFVVPPVAGDPAIRKAPPYIPKQNGNPVVLQPPTTPVPPYGMGFPYYPLQQVKYYELAAYVLGNLVPYDVAVTIERTPTSGILSVVKVAGVRFEILGDDPGEQREGYRLSGPNGRIAVQVQRDVASGAVLPFPQQYGLSAWVMARMQSGRLKYIGQTELDRLGLWTN